MKMPDKNDLIEQLAGVIHEQWMSWMSYLFEQIRATKTMSKPNLSDWVAFDWEVWDRWNRQTATPYNQLSKKEQQSDRDLVLPYLKLFLTFLDQDTGLIAEDQSGKKRMVIQKAIEQPKVLEYQPECEHYPDLRFSVNTTNIMRYRSHPEEAAQNHEKACNAGKLVCNHGKGIHDHLSMNERDHCNIAYKARQTFREHLNRFKCANGHLLSDLKVETGYEYSDPEVTFYCQEKCKYHGYKIDIED